MAMVSTSELNKMSKIELIKLIVSCNKGTAIKNYMAFNVEKLKEFAKVALVNSEKALKKHATETQKKLSDDELIEQLTMGVAV